MWARKIDLQEVLFGEKPFILRTQTKRRMLCKQLKLTTSLPIAA